MRKWLPILIPGLVAIGLIAVVLSPLRQSIQARFSPVGNEVLATAEGDVLNDGSVAKVIKFRSREGLFVEVLRENDKGETLIERLPLPDKHDGLFNFQGHVTRLAIADINHDGEQMLLAPTFDAQLVPHMNVFHYSKEHMRFEPYTVK